MSKKLYLDWDWVQEQINAIGEKLESYDKLEFVAGIPRGGLIPAVIISHAFDIKYISYSSAKMLPGDVRKKTLVVDDISDTGVTMKEADDLGFLTATLSLRVGTKTIPTFVGQQVNNDDWLVFPWENFNSNPIQDYLVNKK